MSIQPTSKTLHNYFIYEAPHITASKFIDGLNPDILHDTFLDHDQAWAKNRKTDQTNQIDSTRVGSGWFDTGNWFDMIFF